MLKIRKNIICFVVILGLLFANTNFVLADNTTEPQIKNIIYMIPDGAAMASFFLADHVKQAGGLTDTFPNATPVATGEMYLKDYLIGAETTYSADNSVTDSAAGGTALSSGYKTNNGMVGITPEKKPRANFLEVCQELGKDTGIVVTYEWTNATPAAFSAHAESRHNHVDIAEQATNQDIDVVFGATADGYKAASWFADEYLEKRGYEVIKSKDQLENIEAGDRVWGKLPNAYYDIEREENTPNLAELTAAAIRALDDSNENGFFLMVEGSAIDGGGHNSNALNMVSEWLAFDEACKVAIEYAKTRTDTLVVILPDHDTGGLQVNDTYTSSSLQPLVEEIRGGTNPASITWEGNGAHTARDGGIFMYVPDGVAYPEGIDVSKAEQVLETFEADFRTCEVNRIDNTRIAHYLAELVGANLDTTSEELFADVTDRGTYNADTEEFSFTNDKGNTVVIERNTSYAVVNGIIMGLDGQVAVYLNDRFYVPSMLLNAAEPPVKDISIHADYNTKTVTVSGKTSHPDVDVTLIVTEPDVTFDGNILDNGITYIDQKKSTPWGEYALEFIVSDGLVGDYNYYTRLTKDSKIEEYNFSFKNMAIKKNGIAVEKMTELKAGDTIDLVLNGYDSGYFGSAIIAQYNASGSLITAKCLPMQGAAVNYEDEQKIPTTVEVDTKTIKAFYWSNALVPFTGVYVIE